MKIIPLCLLLITQALFAGHPLWDLYEQQLKSAKYVDLTHAFAPVQPVWPGFGEATFSATVAAKDMPGYIEKGQPFTISKQGFRATAYVLPSDQYGTQLDPPAHWNPVGATISDLPPTFAVRPLVVISIVDQLKDNAGYELTMNDVLAWEQEYGQIPEGAVVMVRSDWYQKWPDVAHFTDKPFPGVSLPALKFLHLERHILFHGHEPLDTDDSDDLEGEAWLMHHNFAQAEGVMNLDKVPEVGALVAIGYAKPLGGTGGFARYVAICPPDWPYGVTIEEAPGAPLPVSPEPLKRNVDGVLTPGGKPNLIE
ncbi:cyclase family protein [Cerasicoccus maritimus]|uniref:cyclase family protein n=1 Tax=Cerasicoccus maritimus TaxID=490089 RepID=UPI0028528B36|nr:cyclase family protein [Cerasicoccus maritimus]